MGLISDMKKIFITIFSLFFSSSAMSDNSRNLDISAFLDGSYNYLLRSNQFTSGINDRVFDLNQNGFTLQQATIIIADQPKEGFGGLVSVISGHDAFETASYGMNPNVFDNGEIGLDLTQLYIQYSQSTLTFKAGKFLTLAGKEIVYPTRDTNFSRSILFGYTTPVTLTGVRANYKVNHALNLILGVNNGWDNIRDTSRHKTIESGILYFPNSLFSFSLNGLSGQERAAQTPTDMGPIGGRNMIDFFATVNVTDQLSLVVNYDYGVQSTAQLSDGKLGEARWQGIAGYINYNFTKEWLTSFRAEIFDDYQGYRTGVAQVWKELTLTLGYIPIHNLEFRAEVRHDFSNQNAFENKNHLGSSNNQQSFALEAFYQFNSI